MSSVLRATTPEDAPQIAAFCERLLEVPQGSPVFAAEHMHWKYWQPWSSFEGARSYVLTRDTTIVAHGVVLPIRYRFADKTLRFVQVYDWAGAPSAVGAATSLLRRIAATVDGVLAIGGSDKTQRIVRPLGFRPFGRVARYAARRANLESRLGEGPHKSVALRPYTDSDLAAGLTVLRPASTRRAVHSEHDGNALRDLCRCPTAPSTYYEAHASGELLGSFVLTRVPGQARIADAWATHERCWEPLMSAACQEALCMAGIDEVACQTNDALQAQALERSGLQECGSDPLFLLTSTTLIPDEAHVRFQLLDSDCSFLHQGTPERWSPV